MYKLKFSNYLYEDVKSSVNYIKYVLQNPAAAKRLKDKIKKAYKNLKINPFIYPAVPVEYLASKGYRFVNIKNYMFWLKKADWTASPLFLRLLGVVSQNTQAAIKKVYLLFMAHTER